MKINVKLITHFCAVLGVAFADSSVSSDKYSTLTYTPKKGWMNDPNGLVYVDGTYHLFYQYNPNGDEWGDISWGHAVSEDLVCWQELGVALPYNPTTREMIFSGSAVYDKANSSGLGNSGSAPLVAIFTSYFSEDATLRDGSSIEKGTQSQSIAYSVDGGNNWSYYEENPVIRYPPQDYSEEFKDFRDPKVFWYEPHKKWILINVLSLKKKALFYTSEDLKKWTFMSEFSSDRSPEDGIWECPDIFELEVNGGDEKKWVLLLSTNPGGVAGGSGMHYHIGNFDGFEFTEDEPVGPVQYLDYGSDFYAGVTWNNVDSGRFLIGWIDNWDYANKINSQWKGGLGFVRELELAKVDGNLKLIQKPLETLKNYRRDEKKYTGEEVKRGVIIENNKPYEFQIELTDADKNDFAIILIDEEDNLVVEILFLHDLGEINIQKKNINPNEEANYVRHSSEFKPKNHEELKIFIDDNTFTLFNQEGNIVFTELYISKFSKMKLFVHHPDLTVKPIITSWLLANC